MTIANISKEQAEKLVGEKVQQITESDFVVDYYEMLMILDRIYDNTEVKDSFNNNSNCIINLV